MSPYSCVLKTGMQFHVSTVDIVWFISSMVNVSCRFYWTCLNLCMCMCFCESYFMCVSFYFSFISRTKLKCRTNFPNEKFY